MSRTYEGHALQVVLATAGYDHTIRFWEATSGICYRTLQYADSQVLRRACHADSSMCHAATHAWPSQVNKIEISTDKAYLAAGGNPSIRLFDIASGSSQPVHTYDNHTGNVTAVRLPYPQAVIAQHALSTYAVCCLPHCC